MAALSLFRPQNRPWKAYGLLALLSFLPACNSKLYNGAGNPGEGNLSQSGKPGQVDSSLGTSGRVQEALGSNSVINGGALLPDNSIVMGGATDNSSGDTDFYLAKYTASGTLDKTYGNSGIVLQDVQVAGSGNHGADRIQGILTQTQADSSTSIVAAGATIRSGVSYFAASRFNASGVLDSNFGNGGFTVLGFGSGGAALNAVALQSDNKIVAGGLIGDGASFPHTGFAVIRLNENGTLDTNFNGSGIDYTDFSSRQSTINLSSINSIAIHSDPTYNGKIVAAGVAEVLNSNNVATSIQLAIARYNNGNPASLDPSFGKSGTIIGADLNLPNSQANSVLTLPTGEILVGGTYNTGSGNDHILVLRLNGDGSLDGLFGSGGRIQLDLGLGNTDKLNTLSVQSDGKIVGVGTTFSQTNPNDISTQVSHIFVVRFTANGVLDTTFAGGIGYEVFGFLLHDHGFINLLQGSEIVLGGYTSIWNAISNNAATQTTDSRILTRVYQ